MTEAIQLKELSNKLVYLKSVINTVEDKSKLDRNTIYEIVYSHMLLEDYTESGIDDEVVMAEAVALKNSFASLVDSIPNELASKALDSNKASNLDALDRVKYRAKTEGFNGTYTKKAYVYNNCMMAYIKNKLTSMIIIVILAVVVSSGIPKLMTNMIVDVVLGTNSTTEVTSSETTTEALTNGEIGVSTETLDNVMTPMVNVLIAAVSALAAIMIAIFMISFVIDLTFLALPYMRGMLTSLHIPISEDARNSCNTQANGEVLSYIKVKERDRIKRNIALLDIMMEQYDDTVLKSIKDIIVKKQTGKKYYYAIAKIEFIYDRLLTTGKIENVA